MSGKIDRRRLAQMCGAVAASLGIGVLPGRRAVAEDTSPPPLAAFARNPVIQHIALSPDGRRVAFITTSNAEAQLVFFDTDRMEPRSASFGAAKIRGVMWSDNQYIVVTASVTDRITAFNWVRQEYSLGHVVDTVTLKTRTLFSGMNEFFNFLTERPLRIKFGDGYRLVASSYLRQLATYGFYMTSSALFNADGTPVEVKASKPPKLNAEALKARQAAKKALGYYAGAVSKPDGTVVARSWVKPGEEKGRYTWSVTAGNDLLSAPVPIYTAEVEGETTWMELTGLGRTDAAVLLTRYAEQDAKRFIELNLDGSDGAAIEVREDAGEARPLFHPLSRCFCGLLYAGDRQTYSYFDPQLKRQAEALPALFDESYSFLFADYAEQPHEAIVYGESPEDAGTYFQVDFSSGNVIELPKNYPDLPSAWIAPKRPIHYAAHDGLTIHGYLTLPPFREARALPLIVMPHGGPQARDYGDFDWETQALASLGYAVLQPNFRGSSGYGYGFVKAAFGEWGRKMQSDLSDGVHFLAGQGVIDPARVAIVGASYGGYAALAGATIDRGIYRCAIDVAGVSDPAEFLKFLGGVTGEGKKDLGVGYFKLFLGDRKDFSTISPLKLAATASCPILLIHGRDDTVVPFKQSELMANALKQAGKPYEFVAYDGQDHWETAEGARVDMIDRWAKFLARHNPAHA